MVIFRISIVNRSRWPNWFVHPMARWIAERAGIAWAYRLELPNASVWAGRGGYNGSRCRVPRKGYARDGKYPALITETRFKTLKQAHEVRSAMESWVYLVAHEMYHATGGARHKHRKGGRTNVYMMEYQCNEFANKCVEAFRAEWPALRDSMMHGLRMSRARRLRRTRRKQEQSEERGSHSFKMEHARAKLAEWEAKRARCETFISRYRRSIRSLNAAETRRAAKK